MSIHKVFKPARKGDSLRVAYVYADGHVTTSFERYELGQRITYWKIAQSIGVKVQFPIDPDDEATHAHGAGRVVFHNPAALIAISLLPEARIRTYLNNESTHDKAKHIKVATLLAESAVGSYSLDEISTHSSVVSIQVDQTRKRFGNPDATFDQDLELFALKSREYHLVETYRDEKKKEATL